MDGEKITNTILNLFRQNSNIEGIDEDDNMFESGVSSLTIIELQIKVEEELGLTLSTSELMKLSTIKQWVEAYTLKAQAQLHEA